jgi:plasmid stabilization system protein ParE
MKLAFTKEAKFDLGDIGDWIADQDPVRADTIIDELTARCAKLPGMPAHIRWYPLRGNSTIRRVVHGHYLIFYRVTADVVEILRVLHGARDVESILFPDTKKKK